MVNQRKKDFDSPLQEGEFRRIKGIAETTEQALHDAGITNFEQLSRLTPEEIAELLPRNVGIRGTAARLDWAGQAARFAQELPEVPPAMEPEKPIKRKPYQSFMVKLLLDDERNVLRTTIAHVGGTEEYWGGWKPERLTNWIAEHANLVMEHSEEIPPVRSEVLPAEEQHVEPEASHAQPAASTELRGSIQLTRVEFFDPTFMEKTQILKTGDSFGVRLEVDLQQAEIPEGNGLRYRAGLLVRRMPSGKRDNLGIFEGLMNRTNPVILTDTIAGLLEGTYRLEIVVLVYPDSSPEPDRDGLFALDEGRLIHVRTNIPQPVRSSATKGI